MKKQIKLIWIIIFSVITVAAGVFFIFKKKIVSHFIPDVEQIGEIMIKVKNDTTYVSSMLSVKNKSFIKIEIDSIKYKVSLFEKTYLRNQKYLGVSLNSYEADTIDFSIKIPYVAIMNDLKIARKKGDSTNYSISVSLQYSSLFGKVNIPINKSAKIKIPQQPEISIEEVKYLKVGFKSIIADVRIKVINYSDVNLYIKEISYSMTIVKQGNLNGKIKETIFIKPKETTFVNIPIEISINNIGKTIFDVIINKDKYDYSLTLDAILETTQPFKQSFNINISSDGRMELKK